MTTIKNDKELVEALKKGEESAYHQLYKDHFNMVKYFITNNSGRAEDVSDVFQETLTVLFEKARDQKLMLTSAMKTLVYSIARNIWLNRLRDQKKSPKITDLETFVQIEDDDDKAEKEIQFDVLEKCIEALGAPCKSLLTQFYYFKNSLVELAEEFNYENTNTVKSQKYKCMKRLRVMALQQI